MQTTEVDLCADTIAKGLRLLNPDGPFEVRSFRDNWPSSALFDSEMWPEASKHITELADANVYCTINPIESVFGGAAHDSDIVRRRWLYIDIDPERIDESGEVLSGVPATAEEVNEARALAHRVIVFLEFMGWPRPLVCFTGNGIGLYYAIDLINDALSLALVKRILHGLSIRFACPGASVDTSVCNAARITRVPWTWNRKGTDTRARPHRQAKILARGNGKVTDAQLLRMADYLMPVVDVPRSTYIGSGAGLPGTDYDLHGPPFSEILTGWTLVSGEPDNGTWRRPGKVTGVSATTRCRGASGEPIFYCFSSNALQFVAGKPYGKFRALAAMKFMGNVSVAAKKLYAEGWGERKRG